jgi:hypothetical protein
MGNNKTLYIVIIVLVLAVIGGGLFFFLGNNNGTQKENEINQPADSSAIDSEMVNCGKAEDPGCFVSRAGSCLPVTTKMVATDGKTEIDLTILGAENEKCHFERKINNVTDLNCLFPKGTNIWNAIDQTFGNDKGLQKVVDESCGSGW